MFISEDCQKKFLDDLIANKSTVHVYLRNGVKLTGRVVAVSDDLIFFNGPSLQIIYKDRINTIIPINEFV